MSRLHVGDRFLTPAREVTESLRAELVRIAGYTHPLFARPDEVSMPGGPPLPGQAVLLLMGGLVERSGRFDDAVLLMGMRDVRFHRPAVPDTELSVEVEVLGETPHRSGDVVRTMRWTARDGTATLVTADVDMLVRRADADTDPESARAH